MNVSKIKRWVFQLEVRERIVEPHEALSRLEEALADVATAQGGNPMWEITQRAAPFVAVTRYPPNGEIRLNVVAVTTKVAYHNFQGTATLLTLDFEDNLRWRVPYAQVPPDRAVRQKYLDESLGYAETVFDTTVGTIQDFLGLSYGKEAVIGAEQDAA